MTINLLTLPSLSILGINPCYKNSTITTTTTTTTKTAVATTQLQSVDSTRRGSTKTGERKKNLKSSIPTGMRYSTVQVPVVSQSVGLASIIPARGSTSSSSSTSSSTSTSSSLFPLPSSLFHCIASSSNTMLKARQTHP
jgi:hypothetical protein